MSFKAPNHTQTPNDLFTLLPDMHEAELKVTLVIVRDTYGWQQGGAAVELSLTDLMKRTGLSRQGVVNGLKAGRKRGTLYQVGGGKKAAYGLVVNSVDQSTLQTSQPSRPQLVNTVDRTGQLSRPALVNTVDQQTPISATPRGEKPDPERNRKERERKERKQTAAGTDPGGPEARQGPSGGPRSVNTGEQDDAQQGGAGRADAPHGADGATAEPLTGSDQATANAGSEPATDPEKIPGAGAAMAALVAGLAGLRRPVTELIAEFDDRQGWLDLAPARIRELTAAARAEHGNRRYRGSLIEALDDEVRRSRPPTQTTTTDDEIDMAALIDGAPLEGNRRRA